MAQKRYEEYTIGERFLSFSRTITEADLVTYIAFTGLRLPLFLDVEYCKKHSVFGERVFPGLGTASVAAGMLEDVLGRYTLAALGLDKFRFAAPVRIGDTLHAEISVEGKKDTSDGQRGVLTARIQVKNQKGEMPLEFWGTFLMRKGELQ